MREATWNLTAGACVMARKTNPRQAVWTGWEGLHGGKAGQPIRELQSQVSCVCTREKVAMTVRAWPHTKSYWTKNRAWEENEPCDPRTESSTQDNGQIKQPQEEQSWCLIFVDQLWLSGRPSLERCPYTGFTPLKVSFPAPPSACGWVFVSTPPLLLSTGIFVCWTCTGKL